MKCYIIDPKARTVTDGEHAGDLDGLHRLIDCETVEATCAGPRCGPGSNALYGDEEGMSKAGLHSFYYRHGDELLPLVGRGVVLGIGPEGEDTEPTMSIDDVRARITWTDYVTDGNPTFVTEEIPNGIRVTVREHPPKRAFVVRMPVPFSIGDTWPCYRNEDDEGKERTKVTITYRDAKTLILDGTTRRILERCEDGAYNVFICE